MALPQKVIEQLGREPSRTPGWSGQLLMFSSTIFFISLLAYFGLVFGYKPYLDSNVQKLQDQIQAFGQKIPLDQQKKLINFYAQLSNIESLLANHVIASPVFGWLEKNTETNAYFTRFSLNTQTNQLALTGIAKTMDDVSQQLAIFENRPEAKQMSVGNITLTNGLWNFDVALSFDPGYFYHSNAATPANTTTP